MPNEPTRKIETGKGASAGTSEADSSIFVSRLLRRSLLDACKLARSSLADLSRNTVFSLGLWFSWRGAECLRQSGHVECWDGEMHA